MKSPECFYTPSPLILINKTSNKTYSHAIIVQNGRRANTAKKTSQKGLESERYDLGTLQRPKAGEASAVSLYTIQNTSESF